MSWFKAILLLSVLGMTWAACNRPPTTFTTAWPEASFESPATNATHHVPSVPTCRETNADPDLPLNATKQDYSALPRPDDHRESGVLSSTAKLRASESPE